MKLVSNNPEGFKGYIHTHISSSFKYRGDNMCLVIENWDQTVSRLPLLVVTLSFGQTTIKHLKQVQTTIFTPRAQFV